MLRYILKRLIFILFIVWVVSSIMFIFIHLIPGDPIIQLLGEGADYNDIQGLRKILKLDESILVQYFNYQKSFFLLDFGESIFNGKKVFYNIFIYFPKTFFLSICSMLIAVVLSFSGGIISVFNQESFVDTFITFISTLGIAMPNFFLGPLLIYFFSIKLGLFPVSGSNNIEYIVLPSVTLGLSMSAFLTRIIKASIFIEIKKPYILLARSIGLSKKRIFLKHLLKNCLNPIITSIGLQFGALFTGTIITEVIFSWQGIGFLLVNSINRRDFPMIQGIVIFIILLYLTMNLIIDLIYCFLNPRLSCEIYKI